MGVQWSRDLYVEPDNSSKNLQSYVWTRVLNVQANLDNLAKCCCQYFLKKYIYQNSDLSQTLLVLALS